MTAKTNDGKNKQRQEQQQIPCGDDNQSDNGNQRDNGDGENHEAVRAKSNIWISPLRDGR
jgi:hypothetical protein